MPTAICECYWCFAACGRSPTNQTCPHDLCVFLCDLRVSVRLSPIGNSLPFDYFCSFFTCALFFPPNMLCNVSVCAARMAEVNVLDCIRTRALRRSRIYIDCGALAKTNATHCITQAHIFGLIPWESFERSAVFVAIICTYADRTRSLISAADWLIRWETTNLYVSTSK